MDNVHNLAESFLDWCRCLLSFLTSHGCVCVARRYQKLASNVCSDSSSCWLFLWHQPFAWFRIFNLNKVLACLRVFRQHLNIWELWLLFWLNKKKKCWNPQSKVSKVLFLYWNSGVVSALLFGKKQHQTDIRALSEYMFIVSSFLSIQSYFCDISISLISM